MPLTPANKERLLKEEIENRGYFFCESLREMATQGPPIAGKKATPVQRLVDYQRGTLPADVNRFLDPDYLEKMHAGIEPEPVPQVFYCLKAGKQVAGPFATPEEAVNGAMMLRLPPNPDGTAPIEMKNYGWSLLAQLPTKAPKAGTFIPFLYHAREFKRLIEMQADRMDGSMEDEMTQ